MTRETLLAEIKTLAESHAGSGVTPETRLYADLGMTGDDADEFLRAYAAKYDIDLRPLVWLRYFDDEGVDLLAPALIFAARLVSPMFESKWQAARQAEREVTIAHLVDVAEMGAWRDPAWNEPKPRGSFVMLVLSAIAVTGMMFFLTIAAFAVFGLLTGGLGDNSIAAYAGLIGMGLLPIFFGVVSYTNIKRKLASA